jgi:DNA primase
MGRIPDDVIDQVLAAHDIVEVVGRHVPLHQAGRSFKALCPFHEEKTPSFTVNPDRQTFKCFGCGKGGHAIAFLMEHDGLTFPEAVRALAKERGIAIPESERRSEAEQGRVEAVRRALAFGQAFYVRALASDEGTQARAYLEQRGYDEAARRTFGLGYAPAAWDALLAAARRRGLGAEVLEAAGLALARKDGGHYDRFRNRVTFPIADLQGRVITFGARALSPDDQPKYLNGPETAVFKKANTLYALDRARDAIRRSGEALLMEGYTDVLMCHLHGVDRAVAGMGTAFTPRQAALLKRFAARVLLVYDGDEAGRLAAERTLDLLLPEGLDVRVVLLPAGRDVDEILLEEGRESFEGLLAGALGLLDFKLAAVGARHDLATPHGRALAAEEVVRTIARVPRPVERDHLFAEMAERLGGTEASLRQEAARGLERETRRPAAGRGQPGGGADLSPAERVRARTQREAEEALLAAALLFPDLRGRILTAVGPEDFGEGPRRRVYNALLALADAGGATDHVTVARRLAADGEAQAVLAGLPEDVTLEERVPSHIEYVERRRREQRRAREILQDLGASGAAASPGGRRAARSDRPDGGAEPPEPFA